MANCPNKNSQDWKNLVDKYGETLAFTVFLRAGEKIPSLKEAEELLKKEPIKPENISESIITLYQASDADETNEVIEEALEDLTNDRFLIVRKAQKFQLDDYNRQLGRLRDARKVASSEDKKKSINKQILDLTQRITSLEEDMELAKAIKRIEDLKYFGDKAIERVRELSQKAELSIGEIEEANRLIELWQAIGDFSNDIGDDNHPIFTEQELKSERLKHGWTDDDGTKHNGFSYYKEQMDSLSRPINKRAAEYVLDFVRSTLNHPYFTKEDIFKAISDVSWLRSRTLDLSRVPDAMVQAISKAMFKANNAARREADEKIEQWEKLWKAAYPFIKNNPDIFVQLRRDGSKTGNLVYRFSQDFFDEETILREKARNSKNKKDWDNYQKWLKDNTIFFDVRILFNEDGSIKNTPEAEAHKKELLDILGEKGYQYYLNHQTKLLSEYNELKEAKKDSLDDGTLSLEEQEFQLSAWEKENSPFINLDRVLDGTEVKVGNTLVRRGRRNFNVSVPRKVRLSDGKQTGFYDPKFQQIENNAPVYELYTYLLDTLRELRFVVPESQRRNMQINSLPTVKESLIAQFFKGPLKLGAAPIIDKLSEYVRSKDAPPIETDEQSLSTGRFRRRSSTSFVINNEEEIRKYIAEKTIGFVNDNNKQPDRETITKWRQEAENKLAQEKSFDLDNVMRLYIVQALAYKHKSATEDILNLAQESFGSRKRILTNLAGKEIKDQYGNPQTVQGGLKHISELMDYTTDIFYGKPRRAVEGKVVKVYTPSEKKRRAELEDLIQKNQDNFDNKSIDETEFLSNKERLERQLEELGGYVTATSIADSALKWTQLLGMGFNVIAGGVNLLTGLYENSSRAADGRLFNGKQLRSSYWQVLQTILGHHLDTKIASKIRAIDKVFDVTKQAINELYKSDSFRKKFKFIDPYIISERTEFINQMPIILAWMKNKKVTGPNGKEASLFDALGQDGKIKDGYILDSTKSNKEALLDIEVTINQIIKETHGNYDTNSPILAKKTVTGRALLQFRSWMPEMFERRFGKELDNWQIGIKEKGRYISIVDMLKAKDANGDSYGALNMLMWTTKQLLRKSFFMSTRFNDRLNEVDAANMRANLFEAQVLIGLTILLLSLKGLVPDDDDKKKYFYALINLGNRFRSDILLYTNPVEFDNISKNILPISNIISSVRRWSLAVQDAVVDWDEEHWHKVLMQTLRSTPGFSQALRTYRYGDKVLSQW